ncbi:HAD-IC family P-type ATPase, partial [Candidatus Saccharibacteria bacterium]|nr:HAD-IC family P-type ATPase [Candidatus Saccharibacteria bacterium]
RAIETIGTINTIATDKTGTLTENKLSVQDTWQLPGSRDNLPQAVALSANDFEVTHDPLDLALDRFVKVKNTTLAENEPIKTFTFDQKLPISGNLWYYGSKYRLSLKGNPEVLIEQCRLSENDRETCQQALNQLTAEGYRVLALAEVILNVKETSLGTIWSKHHPKFVGLIGVKDTLRPEAKKAIAQAKRAGVTVRMITGDHFETAFQIGKQLGLLARRDQVFDCQQMDMLEESNLQTVVRDALAFSRVTPEDKLKILSILKDSQVVAMTGDGVNDVPALVGAHVGIAMGSGATIAKDAGDIILLDDNFSNIVEAMKEGRIIVSNIRRMLYYLLATNAGEAITAIGALFLKSTMIFTPVQILWVNFVTDSFLVFPLGLEPAENQTMRRKPDDPSAPILSKTLIVRMVLVATSLAALALGVYTYYLGRYGHAGASTLAFAALIVAQWSNAVNARSFFQSVLVRLRTPNVSFYICMAVAIGLQLLVFFGPLGSILHIASVPLASLAIVCAIAFVAPIILVELHKLIAYYLKRNRRTR